MFSNRNKRKIRIQKIQSAPVILYDDIIILMKLINVKFVIIDNVIRIYIR